MDVISRSERRVYLKARVDAEALQILARQYGGESRVLATLRVELDRAVARLLAGAEKLGRVQ